MSRAFVCDDQYDSADDEAPEIKMPIPPGSRNYLTPEGAAKLADELRTLETEERPRLAAEIDKMGKSGGQASPESLSNARRALGRVDRRMEYLSRMASIAETVEPPAEGFERVKFGATATVADEKGVESTWRIVGVDEADPGAGLIGWTSPIARALIGKKPGDTALARLPEGECRYVVVSVR
jgi:transcription elongation factor GreB